MTFAWPHLLWLLILPGALLAWELTRRRKKAAVNGHPKILRVEAGANSVRVSRDDTPLRSGPGVRAWLIAGLALAVLALARPQWGRLELPVFDQSREILLAIDLSRSMLTPDVKPARLDRAKLLIQSLLEKLAGERVGLIVFSGTAFLQSPLSADYEILREFLPALGPDFLPEGGTNYQALIDTSLTAFGDAGSADRFLIILSDGEATDEEWRSRMPELQKRNIRVIGLGVGTAAGEMIPDGSGGFVKDERGAVVLSRLESRTLQELAGTTGGVYRDASSWVDLAALLAETVEAGQKGQFVEKNTVRMVERFQWPLAFALWCFCVSLCYEFPVRPRARAITPPLRTAGTQVGREQGARSKEHAATIAASVSLLLLLPAPCALLLPAVLPLPVRAAATLATPAAKDGPGKAAPEQSALSKIVGRLSAASSPTARDWAELARETVIWGSQLKTDRQDVPEGPIRDALSAVELGSKLDARTADWPKLRTELQGLLEKPEPPPEQQEQNQQQQNQNQENQDDQQQQQEQEQQQQSPQQQNQQNQNDRDNQQQNQPENQNSRQEQNPGESAFGDMTKKEEPPPPTDMQKVGGAPEKKEEQAEPLDPALALPLQKLEQLRAQDSPAQLFQLMEGDKKQPAKKSGKNW